MSKYYKAEDVTQQLLELCDSVDYIDAGQRVVAILNIHKCIDAINGLPTIEVGDDCSDYYKGYCSKYDDGCFHQCMQKQAVENAISRESKWIVDMLNYESICPVCGAKETEFIYGTEMWYGFGESKFCPNCGARMKGADDECS